MLIGTQSGSATHVPPVKTDQAASVPPGQAVTAMVVSIGYVGFLLGPIAIGAAATVVGLPTALWIPVVLAAFVAASAGTIRAAVRQPAAAVTPRPAGSG